jgi:hypothetical protein
MALDDSPRLVGRQRELGLVDETLARAAHGPATLVLRGEQGVGTSRLLAESCTRAVGLGLRVSRAATSPLESDLRYAVLLALLRPLVLGGPPGARADLMQPLRRRLGPAGRPALVRHVLERPDT